MPTNGSGHRPIWGWLAAAMIGGAILRLIGVAYGLPAVYNPDEVAIMNRAIGLGQNGFNPHNFLYPSLYFYALFAWEGAWFVIGRATGVFASLAAFERAFFTDPSSIYIAGRVLTALCGVLTIWATWRMGRRLGGRAAGVIAAALLAVSPLAVRDAHYVKHDVPVTWLIVLAHVLMAAEVQQPLARRRWIWPAFVAGLAMSMHYYAIFLALPLTLLILFPPTPWSGFRERLKDLMVAAAAAALAFVLTSPFLALEPGTAIRDVLANRQIVVDRATASAGLFASLGYYLSWLARDGIGWMSASLAIVGLWLAVKRGRTFAVLTLAFPVPFLLFIANTVPASRYLNPVVPFVCVLAAIAAADLMERSNSGRAVAALIVIGGLAQGLTDSVATDLFFRQADTRTMALGWIAQHVPPNSSILVQPYSVPLRQSPAALREALTRHLGSADRASVKYQRQLALDPIPSPAYRPIFLGAGGLDVDKIYVAPSSFDEGIGLAPLRALAVTHVVLKRYNVEDPSMAALSAALRREGRLVATFSPYRSDLDAAEMTRTSPFLHNGDARIVPALERPGPIIEIWTID
ncbi:MAG: glycosyltransferase family 39 protein [Acidobacteriota bacterium]